MTLAAGRVPGFASYVAAVEERLAEAVAALPGVVADAGVDTLRSGGKRLRPALVYLAAPPLARDRPELETAGCAVELVHMATLVHDDRLDRAPLRRGRATVWKERGPAVAGATGDYLFARAFAVLCATGHMAAVRLLSRACLALARGEVLQRGQAGDPRTSEAEYLERCRLKTGQLFAAAVGLGGVLGGLDRSAVAGLRRFGEALGLAFQIADDVLDCDGQPDTTGKPLGTDLLDGTLTLPLILAARRDEAVARVLERGAGPADVLPTLAAVARSGALAEARAMARRYADEALTELAALDGTVDSRALRDVVRSAVERSA